MATNQTMLTTPAQIIDYSIEVRTALQITAAEARQKAARFLLENVGNMITGGQPVLRLQAGQVRWKVPVLYGLPRHGRLGQLGTLIIDVESGDVLLDESTPLADIERRAEDLYNAVDGTSL